MRYIITLTILLALACESRPQENWQVPHWKARENFKQSKFPTAPNYKSACNYTLPASDTLLTDGEFYILKMGHHIVVDGGWVNATEDAHRRWVFHGRRPRSFHFLVVGIDRMRLGGMLYFRDSCEAKFVDSLIYSDWNLWVGLYNPHYEYFNRGTDTTTPWGWKQYNYHNFKPVK